MLSGTVIEVVMPHTQEWRWRTKKKTVVKLCLFSTHYYRLNHTQHTNLWRCEIDAFICWRFFHCNLFRNAHVSNELEDEIHNSNDLSFRIWIVMGWWLLGIRIVHNISFITMEIEIRQQWQEQQQNRSNTGIFVLCFFFYFMYTHNQKWFVILLCRSCRCVRVRVCMCVCVSEH